MNKKFFPVTASIALVLASGTTYAFEPLSAESANWTQSQSFKNWSDGFAIDTRFVTAKISDRNHMALAISTTGSGQREVIGLFAKNSTYSRKIQPNSDLTDFFGAAFYDTKLITTQDYFTITYDGQNHQLHKLGKGVYGGMVGEKQIQLNVNDSNVITAANLTIGDETIRGTTHGHELDFGDHGKYVAVHSIGPTIVLIGGDTSESQDNTSKQYLPSNNKISRRFG